MIANSELIKIHGDRPGTSDVPEKTERPTRLQRLTGVAGEDPRELSGFKSFFRPGYLIHKGFRLINNINRYSDNLETDMDYVMSSFHRMGAGIIISIPQVVFYGTALYHTAKGISRLVT